MKPERIQMGLRNLPGWHHEEETDTLVHGWSFPAPAVAAKFASFLSELAEARGVLPRIELQGADVSLVLPVGEDDAQALANANLLCF